MEESFLHFVWQYQFINKPLVTTEGRTVIVHKTGTHNADAGPDFIGAQLEIDGLKWAGNVEVHVISSDWYQHQHDKDASYENTILHVVWEPDKVVHRQDKSIIPTLALKNKLDPGIYDRYKKLMRSKIIVPCQKHFSGIDQITKLSALEKTVIERFIEKSLLVNQLLTQNNHDWEEMTYQLIARTFGFKVNSEPFLQLAKEIDLKKVLSHRDDIEKMEALFFGQAGFLEEESGDEYQTSLKRDYDYLKHKYQLEPGLAMHQWKFLRMRPANFPTIRIAQFVQLLHSRNNLFSWLINSVSFKDLLCTLMLDQSAYWKSNYKFGLAAKGNIASLGKSSAESIVINAVIPILVAYGRSTDNQVYIDRALGFLQELPAEQNKITRIWDDLKWSAQNSYDSQGMIQLYNDYCRKRRCLSCNIGMKILRSA